VGKSKKKANCNRGKWIGGGGNVEETRHWRARPGPFQQKREKIWVLSEEESGLSKNQEPGEETSRLRGGGHLQLPKKGP